MAIDKIGFGTINTIAYQCPNVIIDKEKMFYIEIAPRTIDTQQGFIDWVSYKPRGQSQILVTQAFDSFGITVEKFSNSKLILSALTALKKIPYVSNIEPISVKRSEWGGDNFFKGSHTYPAVGKYPY